MPTNPTKNTRKLGSINYISGGRESLELDKNGVLMRLNLRLRFTVTNSATAPVTPLFQALARLINRVDIMAGGRDTVQSIPGYMLAARAAYEQIGIPVRGMGAAVVTTASAVTNYDVTLPVDFMMPLGQRQDDTALDTTGLTQLSCIVTWGKNDASDLFATPNGAAISNVQLDVEGEYIVNPQRSSTGMAVSSKTGKPYLVRAFDYQEIDISASNTAFSTILDSRSGLVVTSFLFVALADSQGNDSIINSMQIDAASFNFLNRDAEEIRAENQRRLRLVNGPTPGMLYVDPRVGGSILNAISTGDLAGDLKATLNVTTQGTVCKLAIQREAVRPLLM